ncbi:MAG TPA: glycine cleavage system aminomethyltransferase GcvT [Solirubrobacteraceae bacterium]|nr:glycine cleavage system aminomethyltransferase GcvT [Solirubrobacteraceae bacterium]
MPSTTDALRRSPLDDRHRAAGAKLIEFAGWEMPLQYEGIRAEHEAVRTRAGVFDVSHMGQIETAGPGAEALLQHLLSNDLRRLPEGGAQYSVVCTPEGGVIDDVFTYRLAECVFLTVTNAANHERDLEWFQRHAPDFDADVIDRRDAFAMLAVQGPRARRLVAGLADGPLVARMHCSGRTVAGVPLLMCGTGYTGEPGVELMMDPEQAGDVWDALLDAGATPAGLGARDTLRLEVGYHLHGNDLDRDHGPIEAGLGWCCREATGFVGSEAVARVRADGPAEKLVAFEMTDRGIARQGNPIAGGGVVTSGTFSPTLDRGIGMAYVPAERSEPGTTLEIDVRGTPRAAEVRSKPLYTPKES